jgi:hypothetical protein
MAKLSVSSKHKGKLSIDGTEVTLLVGRMGYQEFIEFETLYFEYGRPARGSEIDPEKATVEQQAQLLERSAKMLAWVKGSVQEYASFPEGEVEIDGVPVRTGEDIARVFGARQLLMMQVINTIWLCNRLPESLKKKLAPLSDSPDGSGTLRPDLAGTEPEPIADSADAKSFAVIAGVTETKSGAASESAIASPFGETIG